MYKIYRAVKDGVKANSWVFAYRNECVLIDTNANVIELLRQNSLTPLYIFLTHEHYDHCEDLDYIRAEYSVPVIASIDADKAIIDAKKNLSIFENGRGFCTRKADITIKDCVSFNTLDTVFVCKTARGHSAGGMVIIQGKNIFTGDTVLENKKTPTALPTGSKKELKESLDYLETIITNDSIIYPGHGDAFSGSVWVKLSSL